MRDEEQWSIQTLAEAHGVPPPLAMALVGHESNFDPTAVSPRGARGLGQLMPGTAKSLGVDPAAPRQNVDGSLRYLKQQYDAFGSWDKALAAYNGGPGRLSAAKGDISRMPPETRAYVPAVLKQAEKYAAQPAAPPPPAARKYYDYSDLFPRQGGAAAEEPDYSGLFPESRPPLVLSPEPEPQAPSLLSDLQAAQTVQNAVTKNMLTTAGSALTDLGTGAQQRALQATQYLPDSAIFAPLRETSARRLTELEGEIKAKRELMAPALARPGGTTGAMLGGGLPLVAASMVPGGQTLPGAAGLGTLFGGLQPTAPGESALENAIKGGFWNVLSQSLANAFGSMGSAAKAERQASALRLAGSNAERDTTARNARELGLTLPAVVTNPESKTAGFVEGISGKNQTNTYFAAKNQPIIDRLAKQELGLGSDEAITPAKIAAKIKLEYAKGYAPIKAAGSIKADAEFTQFLDDLMAPRRQVAADFPESSGLSPELDALYKDLSRGQWDAGSIVEKVRLLREDAGKNFASGTVGSVDLARAQRSAAKSLEDLIERNIVAQGKPGLVAQFRSSRQKIAIAEDINDALVPSSGQVQAEYFGKKSLNQEPLSGPLKTVGDAYALFRKNGMTVNPLTLGQGASPISALDALAITAAGTTGALGALLTGNPSAVIPAALPLARPALRAIAGTRPYQRAVGTPGYGPGASGQVAGLLDDPLIKALMRGGLYEAISSE